MNGGERGMHPGSRVVKSDQFTWGVYMTLDFSGIYCVYCQQTFTEALLTG